MRNHEIYFYHLLLQSDISKLISRLVMYESELKEQEEKYLCVCANGALSRYISIQRGAGKGVKSFEEATTSDILHSISLNISLITATTLSTPTTKFFWKVL